MAKHKQKKTIEKKTDHSTIYIRPLIRTIIISCILVELLLVLIDLCIHYTPPLDLRSISLIFDMSREKSLANWISSVQTLLVGITVWLIFSRLRMDNRHWKNTGAWFVIAIFFIYMAADDGAEIHEQCANYLGNLHLMTSSPWYPIISKLKSFPTYYWQMLFAPLFLFMGFFMLYFLWVKTKEMNLRKFLIAGLLLFSIAVAMDFFEGLGNSSLIIQNFLNTPQLESITIKHFLRAWEEFLEMFGTTMFWALFLYYFANISDGTKITLRKYRENKPE